MEITFSGFLNFFFNVGYDLEIFGGFSIAWRKKKKSLLKKGILGMDPVRAAVALLSMEKQLQKNFPGAAWSGF